MYMYTAPQKACMGVGEYYTGMISYIAAIILTTWERVTFGYKYIRTTIATCCSASGLCTSLLNLPGEHQASTEPKDGLIWYYSS